MFAILCTKLLQINRAVPKYISLSLANSGVAVKGPRPQASDTFIDRQPTPLTAKTKAVLCAW